MTEARGGQVAVRKPRFSYVGIGEIGTAFTCGVEELAVLERRCRKIRAAEVRPGQSAVFKSRAGKFGLVKVVLVEIAIDEYGWLRRFRFVAQRTCLG
jgi:hypothetical protein